MVGVFTFPNVHATLNGELVGVDNCYNPNRFFLNVSKTSYTIISNQKDSLYNITIRDSIITKVKTVKFLGVTLDENLLFNDYVNKKITECWVNYQLLSVIYWSSPMENS